jgi:hypothetical protein
MGRYLIVAHQTASSPELVDRVQQIARDDPSAVFVLLVPATPRQHLLTWAEGEARTIATRGAESARAALTAAGVEITRAEAGDASPLMAIDDELRDHAGDYDAIVVCTFPPGISRWLKLDIPHQVERYGLPVIHVVAERTPAPTAT